MNKDNPPGEQNMLKHTHFGFIPELTFRIAQGLNGKYVSKVSPLAHSFFFKVLKSSRKYAPALNHSSENNGWGLSSLDLVVNTLNANFSFIIYVGQMRA